MFVELKCKTNFSFLRGASSAHEYISTAAQMGMTALAINDVNGVYSLPRAYESIRKFHPDFKLICGSEITIQDHPPLTLLAKNRKGYGLLCRILTQLHADKEKGTGAISLFELHDLFQSYPHAQDLFCIPKLTEKTDFVFLKLLFADQIFLPISRHLDGLDQKRTDFMLKRAIQYQLPFIATNDVHFHVPDRRPLQDALTCIREGTNIDEAGFLLFGNQERYLKSSMQMQALFSDLPLAIQNTKLIADQCTFCLSELKYQYPNEFIPEGHTPKSYLAELVAAGANETYRGIIPQKVDIQIRRELDFFNKRGDEHYFLTVHDIVRFAKEKNIICQGRGSAANSIVCYVLGITSVDPVHMNLLFDRFMNEGRKEPPDIDIDFEHERREEVIQYIYSRFGRERAAMVGAVATYRTKSAFRELSKAVGINVGTMSADELAKNFDDVAGAKKNRRQLVELLSQQMKGFPRHLGTHTGGFVLSNDPLLEMVPIEPARMENRTIIQWDKDDLETLGLMKIDVLSIGFLTALHKACDLAKIGWRDIPADDPKTYQMIGRSETHGTFQIESRAQMAMLAQTQPKNYYDLVVQVALVRPSPTVGGMVQPFIKGLFASRNGKPFKIGNPKLEQILGRTFGVPIFQEQIMQISIDVGGFTPAEADQLRRSLGKQRTADSVDAMGKKLYNALITNNIPKEFADNLFSYIKGYAHYGFPESHAASYASIAYKSAYMKAHFPTELVCSLINSQPMGFYSVDTLIAEAARNNNVRFLPIHPNKSSWFCEIEEPKTIRMGFSHLRKVQELDVHLMIEQRQIKPFQSIEDFIARTQFSKDVLENFAISDVFACFGIDRRHTFWKSIEFANVSKTSTKNQLSLFDENTKLEDQKGLFKSMQLIEEIQTDHRKLGYSLHGNIMKAIRIEQPNLPPLTSNRLKHLPQGRSVIYAGVLSVFQRPPPAKGTAFITLEDEFGTVDCVLKNEIFEHFKDVIKGSRFLIFSGRIQKRGAGTSLIVADVQSFARTEAAKPIRPMSPMGRLTW